jgi:SnoaL-like polyketide cyclase
MPPIKLEILDMIEEGDRVAVRWQLTATYEGKPFEQSIMAIYRFDEGRIAEDWGISIRGTLAVRLSAAPKFALRLSSGCLHDVVLRIAVTATTCRGVPGFGTKSPVVRLNIQVHLVRQLQPITVMADLFRPSTSPTPKPAKWE